MSSKKYMQSFPNSVIYAFEPFPKIFKALLRNCKNNQNIHPYQLAVTDTTGHKEFFVNSVSYQNSLLPNSSDAEQYIDSSKIQSVESIEVKTITLDDFCPEESIDRISILKMDIQGGELLALKGAKRLLENSKIDLIYTEVLFAQRYEGQANFYELCDFLKPYGFVLYGLYNLTYGKNSVLTRGDAIFISSQLEQSLTQKFLALF